MRRAVLTASQAAVLGLAVWVLSTVRAWWLPVAVGVLLGLIWWGTTRARGPMRLVKVLSAGAVAGSYVWIAIQPDGGPRPWHLLALPLLAGSAACVLLLVTLSSRRRERVLTYAAGMTLIVMGALQAASWLT